MRRTGSKVVALLASVALVTSLVPASALAEAAEGETVVAIGDTDELSEQLAADESVPSDEVPGEAAQNEEELASGEDGPSADEVELVGDEDESGSDELVVDVDESSDDTLAENDVEVLDEADSAESVESEAVVVDEDGADVESSQKDAVIEDAVEKDATDEALEVKDDALEAQSDSGAKGTKSSTKKKDGKKDDAVALEAQASKPTITYQAHVQSIGWQDSVTNGKTAGTQGQGLRMEALRVSLPKGTKGGVKYRAYVQKIGWQGWVSNGVDAGTSGQGLRVEAFKIKLTGSIAKKYDIYYRVHVQKFGWLKWAKNGESAGTAGLSLRMEALQIRLVKKGAAAPSGKGKVGISFVKAPKLQYRGHVQRIGWQDWVNAGKIAGTSGQGLRVEALETRVTNTGLSGSVQLNAHVQKIGWQDTWSSSCGTSGQGLRVEAICAKLSGNLGKYFDIYYRVHAQKVGWMGWAKNGEKAGTSAMALRLEAIEMRLVMKGAEGPSSGSTSSYIDGTTVGKMGYQNPAGFYQVSSKNVQITSAATAPWNYVTPSRIGIWATRDECVAAFVARAREYLGTPYVWDYSCAPGVGVDCIGLVYQCAYACGMDLGGGTGYDDFNPWAHWTSGSSGWHSHDANNFWNYGKVMHVSLSDRRVGDLISWSGHVAIYVGNDTIIEAYPGSVMYSGLWDHGTPRGCMRLFQ